MTTVPVLGATLGLAAACGVILVVVALTSPGRPRRRAEGRLRRLLVDAGLPHLSRASVVVACLACGVVAAIVAIVVSALPVAALLAGITAAALPVLALRRRAARRRRAMRASWPDAVDVLVSGVRAGMSLPEALGGLAVHGPEPLRPSFAGFEAEHWATGSIPGDPVVYTETGGEVVPAWNGPGGLWNIPWDKWLKKSALGSVTGNPDTTDPLTPGPGDSTDQVGA